jgi:hypothetical protein
MTDAPQVAVSLPAVVGAILLAKRREQDLSQLAMAEAVGINGVGCGCLGRSAQFDTRRS